jgi:UDP-glucose 4-epimerase
MKNSSILVVGGAGYIGSHMVKALLDHGAGVLTLDNLSRGNRDLLPGGRLINGDLGDAVLLDEIFSNNNVDAVMHFGAHSIVPESVRYPLEYYENNVAKTIRLLHAMVDHGVKHFIFSSSAAVYGEPVKVPIEEEHLCQPTNPYGATKWMVEQVLKDCDSAYGLKYVSLRYFNAAGADKSGSIGERHYPETHLIPLVLKTALGEIDQIEIYGTDYPTTDGTCIRDYIHVSDLIQAHFLALEMLLDGSESAVYNMGNCRGYSVRDVINTAQSVTGSHIPVVEKGRRPGDPAVLIANSDRIRRELGWKPMYEDLEDIIRTAWIWHQNDAKRRC